MITPGLLQALLLTLIPVGATVIGGILAAFRPPGRMLASSIQHFAGGVIFAAVAVEVLPPIKESTPAITIAGFGAGIVVIMVLRWVAERVEAGAKATVGQGGALPEAPAWSVGLLLTTAVDILIDGLVLGAGFAAGARQGILLTVALTLELLFLGLASAAALGQGGVSRGKMILVTTGLALLVLLGAALGVMILGAAPAGALAGMLAFGAVALMYLVTEELLVEAHQIRETPWITAVFFLGFLIYLVIAEAVE